MTKREIKKLDKLIREKALEHSNRCEKCGKRGVLHCHHIFGRRRRNTRWDKNNICVLCPTCHVFGLDSAHQAPLLFVKWIKKKRGVKWYNKLMRKANQISKKTYEEVLEEIK